MPLPTPFTAGPTKLYERASDSCSTALLAELVALLLAAWLPARLLAAFYLLPCGINKIIHGALHVYFRLLGRHIADSCCSFCPRRGCIKNLRTPHSTLPDPDPVLEFEIAGRGQTSSFMCKICVARRPKKCVEAAYGPPPPPSPLLLLLWSPCNAFPQICF